MGGREGRERGRGVKRESERKGEERERGRIEGKKGEGKGGRVRGSERRERV